MTPGRQEGMVTAGKPISYLASRSLVCVFTTKQQLISDNWLMGKMRQQNPDRATGTDGLQALTQGDDGQAGGRRARLVRRSLLGGGVLVALGAIGVGVVVASPGNTVSDATKASPQLSSAAVSGDTL